MPSFGLPEKTATLLTRSKRCTTPGTGVRFAAKQQHFWWGVSVENSKHGLPRIEHLRQAPAAMRFLSIELLLEDLGEIHLEDIHWVIVGGESGPGARPMEVEWVLSIRDQCRAAKVPFFFKQWGGVRKGVAGRMLGGQTYDGFPSVVPSPVPSRDVWVALLAEIETMAATFCGAGKP